MIVLALDTCLAACSAAVRVERGGEVRFASRYEARRTGHAEALPGMIAECAREAGIAVCDVTRIAVTRGPGTFTGVRVSVAAARALALATGAPIVATTSLALIAATALDADPTLSVRATGGILVAAPGPQAYLYVQCFDALGRTISEAAALEADGVRELLEPGMLVIGPGASRLSVPGDRAGPAIPIAGPDILPDARVLARQAGTLAPLAAPLLPLYIRPPDAKPQDGKSVPRVS